MSLLLINLAGHSGKELNLNGVSITNSTALSNTFHDLLHNWPKTDLQNTFKVAP